MGRRLVLVPTSGKCRSCTNPVPKPSYERLKSFRGRLLEQLDELTADPLVSPRDECFLTMFQNIRVHTKEYSVLSSYLTEAECDALLTYSVRCRPSPDTTEINFSSNIGTHRRYQHLFAEYNSVSKDSPIVLSRQSPHIPLEITALMNQVHINIRKILPTAVTFKWSFIYSDDFCPRQQFHCDDADMAGTRDTVLRHKFLDSSFSMLFAFMDNSRLVFGFPDDTTKEITKPVIKAISRTGVLAFRGDKYHAGDSYYIANNRLFVDIGVEKFKRNREDIALTPSVYNSM